MLGDQQMSLTASIGIAVSDQDQESGRDLLRNADTAMYRAKSRGKGYWEVFNQGMRTQVVRRMQLTTTLKTAVREQQFRVLYQPIVDVRAGAVSGV